MTHFCKASDGNGFRNSLTRCKKGRRTLLIHLNLLHSYKIQFVFNTFNNSSRRKRNYKTIHLPPLSVSSRKQCERSWSMFMPQLRVKRDLTDCFETRTSSSYSVLSSFHADIEYIHWQNMSSWEPLSGMWCAQIKSNAEFHQCKTALPCRPTTVKGEIQDFST